MTSYMRFICHIGLFTLVASLFGCKPAQHSPDARSEPPLVSEIVGDDAVSRAKYREVEQRCTRARSENEGWAWCNVYEDANGERRIRERKAARY